MHTIEIIALTMGVAWASGINLYAAIFMLGYLGNTGHVALPSDLMILTDPLVISAAGLMYCIEFFADKVPGLDSAWDSIHTFIRVPAGAILAMGAVGETSAVVELVAFILGGTLAASSHVTKTGSRMIINTSPEPASNWTASVVEDVSVFAGLWIAMQSPVVFICLLIIFLLFLVWFLPKLWQAIQAVYRKMKSLFAVAADSDRTSQITHTTSQRNTDIMNESFD